MNIFLRELKAHRWALLFWSLGMVALVGSGMAKFAAYKTAGQSVEALMAGLPKTVRVVFGMTDFDLTKAIGFYGVLFLYIALMAAVHAVLLGSGLISKEERDRTSEFLFAKPVSRESAVTSKLLAGLVGIVVLNVVTLASSLYLVAYFDGSDSHTHEILVMMAGLFLLQLIFFSVGAAVAGIVHKPKAAPSIASSIMFLTFLLSYLVNMNSKLDFLKYFSPFQYFDASRLMADGRLETIFVVLSLAIVAVSVAGTYRFFAERDLRV